MASVLFFGAGDLLVVPTSLVASGSVFVVACGAVLSFLLHPNRQMSRIIGRNRVTFYRLARCGTELKWLIFLKPAHSEFSLRT